MRGQVLDGGLEPACVTGDSWYSCADHLQRVRNHPLGFLFAVESNRRVSLEKGQWVQVQQLTIPAEGQGVWLRGVLPISLRDPAWHRQLRYALNW